jgi:hypothetical protein
MVYINIFMASMEVVIKAKEHANLDSFSFRYGYYFLKDTNLKLHDVTEFKDRDIRDSDKKYAVRGSFNLPGNNKSLQGKFILLRSNNSVVTVIREGGVFKTEELLSETLRKLRLDGDINADDNVEMNKKNIRTHIDVIKYLSDKIGSSKVRAAEDEANLKIEKIAEALRKTAERADLAEQRITELEQELQAFEDQETLANSEGKTQSIERAKILKDVHTNVSYRGSSCTELEMDDGTRLYMKTITFDRNLTVTKKAQSLKGKKVITSCWNPIGEPDKWTNQSYFRNVYELTDDDFN